MNTHNAPEPVSIPVKPDEIEDEVVEIVERGVTRRKDEKKNKLVLKPVPRQGFPKQLYDTRQLLGRMFPSYQPSIPSMNRSDRAKYDFEQQLMRIAALEDKLRRLTSRNQRLVATANSKGGVGKSPLTAYLACIAQQVSRDPMLLIDANESVGTAHELFGVERNETILLRQAVAERHLLRSYSMLAERATKHLETGVRIIGSDFHTEGTMPFDLGSFEEMGLITDSTVHSTFLDTGNGFTDVSNIGSVDIANALLFPALAGKQPSFDGLAKTMLKYSQEGFTDKVKNGFVVINATEPGATKQEFLDLIEKEAGRNPYTTYNSQTGVKADAYLTVEDLGIVEERLFLIPFSAYIAGDGVVSPDPRVIGYDTYEAFLSILVAVYRQNATYPLSESFNEQRGYTIVPSLTNLVEESFNFQGSM